MSKTDIWREEDHGTRCGWCDRRSLVSPCKACAAGLPKAPNEGPILFTGEMVKAILEGRKTQTRRIVCPQPTHDATAWACYFDRQNLDGRYGPPAWGLDESPGEDMLRFCPHGRPGDRLWVKETWRKSNCDTTEDAQNLPGTVFFKADEPWNKGRGVKWFPSIFMFRWASRINLILDEVRVERLQSITEADAVAEGIYRENVITWANCNGGVHAEENEDRYFFEGCQGEGFEFAKDAYSALWDKINGKKKGLAWDANPWVWVESFHMEQKGAR